MRQLIVLRILAVVLTLSLGLAGVDLILRPDAGFSETENRYLEKRPEFSWQDLISGQYGQKLEKWMSDQIAGRDQWVGVKAEIMRLIGFRENRGIYFGRDGFLLQRFIRPEDTALAETIRGIQHLQTLLPDIPVTFLLAPTLAAIYPDKLPPLAVTDDQATFLALIREALGSDILFVDLLSALQNKSDEYIYFRTDHHWTMLGAYYSWQAWQQAAGRPTPDLDTFYREVRSESFHGTSWSRAGLYSVPPDLFEILTFKTPISLSVSFPADGTVRDSLYDESWLSRKDKYGYFFGGNHPLVVINSERPEREAEPRRLMIIKNSYANSLIPFLVQEWDEIHVIDLRYNQNNLARYAIEQGIDEILYLYDVIGFANDRLLRLLSRTSAP